MRRADKMVRINNTVKFTILLLQGTLGNNIRRQNYHSIKRKASIAAVFIFLVTDPTQPNPSKSIKPLRMGGKGRGVIRKFLALHLRSSNDRGERKEGRGNWIDSSGV